MGRRFLTLLPLAASGLVLAVALSAPAVASEDKDFGCTVTRNIETQTVDMNPRYAGTLMEGGVGKRSAAAVARYMTDKIRPLTKLDGSAAVGAQGGADLKATGSEVVLGELRMGYEQTGLDKTGLDMTGQGDPNGVEPWRRNDGRAPGSGPLKVVFVPRGEGRAPDAEALSQAGITLQEQPADLSTLAENSPLLNEADAVVVEVQPGDAANLDAFDRLIHLAAGGVAVVAAVEGLTVADTRTLLRAGALDVLPIPFSAEELRQAVEPARRPVRPALRHAAPQRRQGKVVAFMGALGGVGTTSIAVQTGAVLGASSRVGLVDLDVQFGSAALFLNLHPSLHIGNLIEDAERLDAELLQSVAVRHASSLEVLPSPPDVMPLDIVTQEFVDQLLRTAVQIYDVVLVDLPQAWTEWSVRVLQRADAVVLVTNLSVSGVYQARRQLEVLEANGLTSKLKIVANRVPTNLLGRKADTKETEAVLRRKVDYTVGNDYPGMSGANDEGVVLKASRLLKDVQLLAASLAESLAAEASPQ